MAPAKGEGTKEMRLKLVKNSDHVFGELDQYWHAKVEVAGKIEQDILLTEAQVKDAIVRAKRKEGLLNGKSWIGRTFFDWW